MFVFHEIHPDDLDELHTLAAELDTLNLPDDREALETITHKSRASFRHDDIPVKHHEYVFGLRNLEDDRLVGACMIVAQHGTYERPAVYFNVREEQKYSETLDRFFNHETLELEFDYHGPTEVGGLILAPDYREHRLKLGKLLSYIRFLFIGMHRSRFRDRIVADLLPPLRDDGGSDLWDCLGQHFTELHYRQADRLSRDSVEFVQSLFPSEPIYTSLLPDRARDKIGVVGQKTKPAAVMLESIGFSYDHRIDPFDGGPTYAVETDTCTPVERTEWMEFAGSLSSEVESDGLALVGCPAGKQRDRFRAALAAYRRTSEGVQLRTELFPRLQMIEGERLGWLPLSGSEYEPLYTPRPDRDEGP